MTVSCGNDSHKQAQALLEEASQLYDNRHYDKALATIDSLRKVFPNSVEVRKKALTLHQRISLSQAQDELARVDSMLQEVTKDYNYQKMKVDKDRANLCASVEELRMFNRTKARMDSLKVAFDTQCAKIKYIHRMQKK